MISIQRLIAIILGLVVISFYYFPVQLSAFPVSNSKNLLAGLGVFVAVMVISRHRSASMDKGLLVLAGLALLVSLAGLVAVAYNSTNDYTYARYARPFITWLSAAYAAVFLIRQLHGRMSVEILCNYFIAMCVLQCVSVLLIDNIPAFKSWANSTIMGLDYIDFIDRKYGLGPTLDVAGTRFAAVEIMTAFMIHKKQVAQENKMMIAYIAALLFILVVGNMVARTTTIGAGVALVYLVWMNKDKLYNISKNSQFWKNLIGVTAIGIIVITYLYNNNAVFRENFRFAFEGFFNWWERGDWQTTSTDTWKKMIIWPDNLKTWLIGDGYFDGPTGKDPYYIGPDNTGYYKWTDIGYLRFIFYFGMLGLLLFIGFFIKATHICVSRFARYKYMFIFFCLLNMVIWFKVSTDIFIVFAPFLCISQEENEEYERL